MADGELRFWEGMLARRRQAFVDADGWTELSVEQAKDIHRNLREWSNGGRKHKDGPFHRAAVLATLILAWSFGACGRRGSLHRGQHPNREAALGIVHGLIGKSVDTVRDWVDRRPKL